MEKIYIATFEEVEGYTILKVFASLEAAENFLRDIEPDWDSEGYVILERDLNN